ncbi:MAG: nitronate monooxygenase [Anaerolineae bacterium]|nr:nitronate monooxygenase [Anaerolineae bacterium]MDW8172956.1 nitronate monooxygenase [Anaerolineae bacterium]
MFKIIQGGMGVSVSSWRLANAVSRLGQLGVVSGTGIGTVLAARLAQGDQGGHIRRALDAFPFPQSAERVWRRYYTEGGRQPEEGLPRPPMWTINPPAELEELTVVANFVEVWLAKEGHKNPVGINLLEKVQLPTMASLYGAMLAGVDVVLMGAGIPLQVPGILDALARHKTTQYRLDVLGATQDYVIRFDPRRLFPLDDEAPALRRPLFFPIISSNTLAQALLKRANGRIDGFVVETPVAGGHNAPPRQAAFNDKGEPIYGDKDRVDYTKLKALGLPFWIGGGYGSAKGLRAALAEGAEGVQVGTAFAYCDESGMAQPYKEAVLRLALREEVTVTTSARVSPTGFPFKVVHVPGTLSDGAVYEARERICDMGFLRHLYQEAEGKVGYRCPAAPVAGYVKKGGAPEDTEGRMCLCNGLGAAAGYAQHKGDGVFEPAIITSGDDVVSIGRFVRADRLGYSAADVIRAILG